jgi:hypothetical protein
MEALKYGEEYKIAVIPGIEVATGIKTEDNRIIERRDVLVYFPDIKSFKEWALKGYDSKTIDLFKRAIDKEHNKRLWGNVRIEEVIEWAKRNKGISILAHPGYFNFETEEKLEYLFKKGLDGIEIYNLKFNDVKHYNKASTGEVMKIYFEMIKKFEKELGMNKKPLVTVGSDSHSNDSVGNIKIENEFGEELLEFYELSKFQNKYGDTNLSIQTRLMKVIIERILPNNNDFL